MGSEGERIYFQFSFYTIWIGYSEHNNCIKIIVKIKSILDKTVVLKV